MQRLLLQRFFLALLLAGACVGSSLGCGGALSLEDVDPMHPGGRPELGLPVLSFRWKFAVADRATESIPQEFSSAAVASGRVFIGSATGELDALDADTGALLWRTRLGGIATRPVVERGRLYLGTSDGAMVCLDAMEGTVSLAVRDPWAGTAAASAGRRHAVLQQRGGSGVRTRGRQRRVSLAVQARNAR